jgi:O-methyltransferase
MSLYMPIDNPWALKQTLYTPWAGEETFESYAKLARPYTLVTSDRLYVLFCLTQQAMCLEGDFIECGVYKGGTARMIDAILAGSQKLSLYDTFTGMPEVHPDKDLHKVGDFADTSVEAIRELIPTAILHPGLIPDSFEDLPKQISFAHIDVDIYQSVKDCCEWIYDRLTPSGFMIFDDYGSITTPGCREAVDEFFTGKPEVPLILATGQALVVKI